MSTLAYQLNKAGSSNAAYVDNSSVPWSQSQIDSGYKGISLLPGNSYANSYGGGSNSYLTGGTSTSGSQNNQNSDAHPIQSANGNWVNSSTGAAWHGSYKNPNGSTEYYSNGQKVSDVGQVGVQTPQITSQQIQKNPELSNQVSGAISQNATNTGLLGKSFNDYLKSADSSSSALASEMPSAISSINPEGTINRLNSDTTNASTKLDSTLADYTTKQNQNQANIAGANQGYQQKQDDALAKLKDELATENSNYETAAQNVAKQAYANAGKQIGLYHLTSGTPTSGSGALDNRYIGAYNSINVPLQQDLANRAISTTNQLYNTGSNLQNQYLTNQQSQYAGQGALNSDLANRSNTNTQYTTGLDQNTATTIQNLRQTVAQMKPEIATKYLQAMGYSLQTAQQIIAGNTSNLQGLTNLDQTANAYNLVTNYQNNSPSYTSPNVYSSGGGGGGGAYTSPTLDQAISSVSSNNYLSDAQQQWLNTAQGQQWLASQNRKPTTSNSYQTTSAYGPVAGYDYAYPA